ncbi:MAG: ABC transporter ATP-binding protein [Candidatus Solibacter usitatus]|nr:ABC transporter ATP-binding protein [Candidatus Solibacter usitatus]
MAGQIDIDIRKRFASGAVVEARLHLALEPGSVAVLFGPSGSGKTTILRSIAGLEQPERGSIQFEKETWFDAARGVCLSPQQRRIGYLFQEFALFPHLTVRQNIEYGLRGRPPVARGEQAGQMMALVEIADLADRHPRQLSGGQAQRVALARALAPEPRLLLLDEPLASLDAPARSRLRGELRGLLIKAGTPALLVTHDRTEAIALGDQMVVVAGGKIQQVGPVQEVFSRPANLEVARSVGVETIVAGRVTGISDGLATVQVDQELFTAVPPDDLAECKDVFVCFRAEDVTLQTGGPLKESARNHLAGQIVAIDSEGAVERITLDCGFPMVALVTRHAREEMGLALGAIVTAAVKATAVHLIPRN